MGEEDSYEQREDKIRNWGAIVNKDSNTNIPGERGAQGVAAKAGTGPRSDVNTGLHMDPNQLGEEDC